MDVKTAWTFRVEDVPAVGNCLFEAVGRTVGVGAAELRAAVCAWMVSADARLHDTPVRDWIQWNAGVSVGDYAARMARSGEWGGGVELAVLSTLLRRPILVYERFVDGGARGVRRIAEFLPDGVPADDVRGLPVVCILYVGRAHYMQLVPVRKP